MSISSIRTADVPGGMALKTTIEGEYIRSYAVVSAPDLNAIAHIVPSAEVAAGGEIHATAVSDIAAAQERVFDVLDNVNPGDIAVFLCSAQDTYEATLALLGYGQEEGESGLH